MNLRSRVTKLEASAPGFREHYCMVVHFGHGDCTAARGKAISNYVEMHGREPELFHDVLFIDPATKQNICGCKEGESA